jgi:2-aminomuconate deaminase
MKDDFPIYNRIYAEYFKDNQPCRTTLGITALPTPIAIELKVIAAFK